MTWKKDGKTVKSKKKENRVNISQTEDVHTLEVKDATAKDAGEYTVTAKNSTGSVTSTATVEVLSQEPVEAVDSAAIEAPKFEVAPQPVSVTEGETIRLTCQVSGTSATSVACNAACGMDSAS